MDRIKALDYPLGENLGCTPVWGPAFCMNCRWRLFSFAQPKSLRQDISIALPWRKECRFTSISHLSQLALWLQLKCFCRTRDILLMLGRSQALSPFSYVLKNYRQLSSGLSRFGKYFDLENTCLICSLPFQNSYFPGYCCIYLKYFLKIWYPEFFLCEIMLETKVWNWDFVIISICISI